MNIKPLGKRLVVKKTKMPTSKGGIILPDTAKEKPKTGEVVSIGPGEISKNGTLIPLALKTGDKVLFSTYSGVEFNPNEDEEFLILSEDDILAVIN